MSDAPSIGASWEYSADFDDKITDYQIHSSSSSQQWVDWRGIPIDAGEEATATSIHPNTFMRVLHGERLADVTELQFRHPNCVQAGELYNHNDQWQQIAGTDPSPRQAEVLKWVHYKVSVFDYFRPFKGVFKGKFYNSARPPSEQFQNNF